MAGFDKNAGGVPNEKSAFDQDDGDDGGDLDDDDDAPAIADQNADWQGMGQMGMMSLRQQN